MAVSSETMERIRSASPAPAARRTTRAIVGIASRNKACAPAQGTGPYAGACQARHLGVQPTISGRSRTVMIVVSMVATDFSAPSTTIEASAWHTVIVRPARTTRPRAINSCPRAGASRFVLNSNVSTPAPSGIRLNAAYPHALSSAEVTTPAWRNPCCWVKSGRNGTRISISPAATRVSRAPMVAINCCAAKLARTACSNCGFLCSAIFGGGASLAASSCLSRGAGI